MAPVLAIPGMVATGVEYVNEFANQVVLITGAKGGLGTHVTEAFLAAGATVVGTSRSIADADFPNPRFAGVAADLTNADAARQLTDGVMQRFKKIDALVHVMGGFAGGQSIAETSDDIRNPPDSDRIFCGRQPP